MPNTVAHVVFPGKEARRLEELRIYLGHVRELDGPVSVSQAVRTAVRHLHRHFRRLSAADRKRQRKG